MSISSRPQIGQRDSVREEEEENQGNRFGGGLSEGTTAYEMICCTFRRILSSVTKRDAQRGVESVTRLADRS